MSVTLVAAAAGAAMLRGAHARRVSAPRVALTPGCRAGGAARPCVLWE
jgi:hypothetical protein